jgi:hypothetical protein
MIEKFEEKSCALIFPSTKKAGKSPLFLIFPFATTSISLFGALVGTLVVDVTTMSPTLKSVSRVSTSASEKARIGLS